MTAVVSMTTGGGALATVAVPEPPLVSVVRDDGEADALTLILTYDDPEYRCRAVLALPLDDVLGAVVEAARRGGPAVSRTITRSVISIADRLGPPEATVEPTHATFTDDNVVYLIGGRCGRQC